MAIDSTLDAIAKEAEELRKRILALYDVIRDVKEQGYSYNELESATEFSRGTLQNIAAGRNPRFSIDE